MFQVGEYVVCGSRAVCRVEAIGPLRFKECGGGEYYTLCPPFTSSEEKIYVPVDTALPIRRIVTGREALEALCCLRRGRGQERKIPGCRWSVTKRCFPPVISGRN